MAVVELSGFALFKIGKVPLSLLFKEASTGAVAFICTVGFVGGRAIITIVGSPNCEYSGTGTQFDGFVGFESSFWSFRGGMPLIGHGTFGCGCGIT